MTALVSVVIPTRNRSRLVQRAVRSALGQLRVDVEVIVVDDGSTDGTADELRSCGDGRVMVMRHDESRGVAIARNAGISAAAGEWLAFLDDDDVWAPDKLAAQLAAMEQHGCEWSCVGVVVTDGQLSVRGGYHPPDLGRLHTELLTYNVVPGGASGVVARTQLVRAIGAFDPELSLFADWDLWIRLARASCCAAVDRPLLAYTEHAANMCLDPQTADVELAQITRKYEVDRRALGAQVDEARWLDWLASNHRRAGHRGTAARLYLSEALRSRRLRSFARSGRALIARGPRGNVVDATTVWSVQSTEWLGSIRTPLQEPHKS